MSNPVRSQPIPSYDGLVEEIKRRGEEALWSPYRRLAPGLPHDSPLICGPLCH